VSERPSPETWTAELTTRGGRLPDLEKLEAAVRKVGDQFRVRGLEATVEGVLERRASGPVLVVRDQDLVLPLTPLTRKVQWETRSDREQPATDAERGAHSRLLREWRGRPRPLRVTGPIVRTAGTLPGLQVREFAWTRPAEPE
jgi:hypothetical protein